MEQYVIKGGNPLNGEVEIGGAKNAALAILAAAIMTDETVTIENLPNVRDINVLLQAIAEIGAMVDRIDISIRSTIAPISAIACNNTLISLTFGKFSIVTVSSVMIAAARIASAAFFAPPISTSPFSGFPPLITYCSISHLNKRPISYSTLPYYLSYSSSVNL